MGEIQLGSWCKGGEEHRRTEEDRDLSFSKDGDEVRAGPDLLLGQHDHGAARHPGAVHLRDAAVVAQRRSERGCVHAGKEIEVIGVAQGKVHVTCVRALDSLGHPSGAARVKNGRKALRGVIQPPRRRFSAGHPLRQRQDVERRQVAKLVLPPRQNDYRLCVVEHVGDQGVGQGGIEDHHRAASLENAKVRGDDLPIVLRHGHGHDLVGSCEEGRKGRGHALCSRIELSEGQGFAGVGNLQGRKMRKFLGRAAEDFREPPDPFLMRHVHEGAVAEDIRQGVLAGIRRPVRHLLRRPKVPPPSHKRQRKENRDGNCYQSCCQNSSPQARRAIAEFW
jgi:hypothetical protein